MPRILGVIPARGGSKGIPRKNLAPLAGRPLLAWTIDAARQSRHLTQCVVSTENDEIAGVARALGATVLPRPVELASDADVRDRAQASDEEESILAGQGTTVMCARLVPPVKLREGSELRLSVDTRALYLFDSDGNALRDEV